MKTMISLFILILSLKVAAQVPGDSTKFSKKLFTATEKMPVANTSPNRFLSEDCSNGIDDDGNGLIDMKDPFCYFSHTNPDTCIPTRVLWATFGFSVYWVDLDTHADKLIPLSPFVNLGDIAWSPTGILYGAELSSASIWKIDPNTGHAQWLFNYPGYNAANGMTCDAAGNIYLEARDSINGDWKVIRVDPVTGISKLILDLTSQGLVSAGDLTFMEGYLYASCQSSKLVKIDIGTGNFNIITYTGSVGTTQAYGLVNIGDGYLYMSSTDIVFRVDPTTWTSTFYLQLPTSGVVCKFQLN